MDDSYSVHIEREKELLTFWIATPEVKTLDIIIDYLIVNKKLPKQLSYDLSFPEFFSDKSTYNFLDRVYPENSTQDDENLVIVLEDIEEMSDFWGYEWKKYFSLWQLTWLVETLNFGNSNIAYVDSPINPEKELLSLERER